MRISDWSSDVCSSDLANDVVLPGPAQLAVGSAIVDADVTLYDQPHIVADIQIADTQIRDHDIAVGRVKIDYKGGSGKAQALVEGTSGVPFRIAANAIGSAHV